MSGGMGEHGDPVLRDGSYSCPACGYDLRGTEAIEAADGEFRVVCPECGWRGASWLAACLARRQRDRAMRWAIRLAVAPVPCGVVWVVLATLSAVSGHRVLSYVMLLAVPATYVGCGFATSVVRLRAGAPLSVATAASALSPVVMMFLVLSHRGRSMGQSTGLGGPPSDVWLDYLIGLALVAGVVLLLLGPWMDARSIHKAFRRPPD